MKHLQPSLFRRCKRVTQHSRSRATGLSFLTRALPTPLASASFKSKNGDIQFIGTIVYSKDGKPATSYISRETFRRDGNRSIRDYSITQAMRLRKLYRYIDPRLTYFEFCSLAVMFIIITGLALTALTMQVYATFF